MLTAVVHQTIASRRLFADAKRVLVACSGGPDSQALLHVLHALADELGLHVVAASVDHGLRRDAARDVAVAADLAARLGVPFHALRVQVQPGPSRQAWARAARYGALLACARELGAERVAVGHTQDDQAETVLSRMLRGTGLDGLSAIAPRREDGVVRPLIDATRSEVHAYVEHHGLPVALDPSNLDPRYTRVRVREAFLPLLQAENPRLATHLSALADDAREARAVLGAVAEAALARAGGQVSKLKEECAYVRRFALRVLVERELGTALRRTHLVALDRMLWRGGQVRLPGDFVASLGHNDELVLQRVSKRGRGHKRPTQGTESE